MELSVQELRIGNYIHGKKDDENIVCTVTGYEPRDEFIFVNNGKNIHYAEFVEFSPIPLTEEWLFRFGFAKTEREDEDFTYFKKDNIELCDVSPNGFELIWYELSPCIYVHHLQNLYFALTGEELRLQL